MLELFGPSVRTPHGLTRRRFLQTGAVGLSALAAMNAPLSGAAVRREINKKAVILVFLSGGPSQTDTFDPKPDAPEEFRGPFRSIPTCLPGVRVTELFPRIARRMDRLTILRSVAHKDGSHHHSYHWMLTGLYPANLQFNVNQRPAVGAVAARFCGPNRQGMPPYVTIPRASGYGGPAYLGVGYSTFEVGDPNAAGYQIPGLKLPAAMDPNRLVERRGLLNSFDTMRRDLDVRGTATGMDSFSRAAFDLVTNEAARKAFDLGGEPDSLRDHYGRTRIGQSLLLARRLAEAGVTFTLFEDYEFTEWDLHGTNNGPGVLKGTQVKGPHLDRALSALVDDLDGRGMLDDVLIVVMGEFGRTPRINKDGGRDHWGNVFSVMMAGGGLRHGQVIGASTSKAEDPKDRPVSPGDILATIYHVLGVDPELAPQDNSGRPIPLLAEGRAIRELL